MGMDYNYSNYVELYLCNVKNIYSDTLAVPAVALSFLSNSLSLL